ncbi:MAG: XRE family transcriptional regulator [Lachnospiraceae bacterium]|nr:XRE family transcriptional regulator [Lachnospiraceae bacterium]MBQ8261592.1 XRE family transcriptional regulator [Lachnospiraceae bacterium]
MGKKATKAVGNMYYDARCEALKNNEAFSSREGASEVLHIERTRLANIELGNITPYPEEVKCMAKEYNMPELCNAYCANECPIGKGTVTEVRMDDFDRLSLMVLGSLQDIDRIRESLIEISEDGVIEENEMGQFNDIIDSLEKIATNAQALKLWAEKNIRFE